MFDSETDDYLFELKDLVSGSDFEHILEFNLVDDHGQKLCHINDKQNMYLIKFSYFY